MKKRFSIRRRIQLMTLLITAVALMLTTSVGLISMLKIQREVIAGGRNLGDNAASTSEKALLEQMEQSLLDIVGSKAKLADSKLGKFSGYIDMFAAYTTGLYEHSADFLPKEVLPPSVANKGVLSMQRYLLDATVDYDRVEDEVSLLGNLTPVFDPVIRAESAMITTIYVGTRSGFLLSYDATADLGANGEKEAYYDFQDATWYTSARDARQTVFTDTYLDSYGRGLTISCASPFYDSKGDFAGVVGMDILIADLNQSVIDTDISAGSYAVLVDNTGRVIASPHMDATSEKFDNITDRSSPAYSVSDRILSGGTGVVLNENGAYYAYTPVSSAAWTLVIHVPEKEITAPALQINTDILNNTANTEGTMRANIWTAMLIFLISFLLLVALAVWLTGMFSKQLTNPLMALREDVADISAGNLQRQAKVCGNDEIGDLAVSFNHMSVSLQQYIADLTSVTAEKERIGAELDVAKNIQASMLPCIFPAFPERQEIDIFATMTPAKEVGGDFYDFFLVDDNHLAMVMADVSGKGVPAALFMVIAKTMLKNAAQTGLSPKAVLESVNNQLCEGNQAEMFVTVWIGLYDFTTGKLVCANAGHEYPAVMHKDGEYELIHDRHGFVLAGMEGSRYREYELQLAPGDKLFLYTDGVAEATDASNELYGTDRMLAALNRGKGLPVNQQLPEIKADIDRFVGDAPQFDDITMLSFEVRKLQERNDRNDENAEDKTC